MTDRLPDYCFRSLNTGEQEAFRQWARDNYKPLGKINPCWHPIVQAECRAISGNNRQQDAFRRAVNIYCDGLESVAVGCLGVKCEHARTADCPDCMAIANGGEYGKGYTADGDDCPTCEGTGYVADEDHQCEASFSWSQCDSCGSTLGGDRETAYGIWRNEKGEIVTIQMSICVDCTMYHANGELPEVWQD